MDLLHDIAPNLDRTRCVGAGNERPPAVRVVESVPDRRRVVGRVAAEPAVKSFIRGTGLARGGLAANIGIRADPGRVANRIDQKVRHNVRGFRGEHLLKVRLMLQQNLAVGVKNPCKKIGLCENATVCQS